MGKRLSVAFGVLFTLAACGADATATETADDLTNDAPESLADAGSEVDEPTVDATTTPETSTSSTVGPQTVTTSAGFDELTNVTFVDESNNARPTLDDEADLSALILDDLNSLGYRWESEEVVVGAPNEQTGDVTTVSTYTATAWTTIGNPDGSGNRTGARVVYDMTTTSRVTTADGVVLDQAIVNDCLNLNFCPEGVSRETVTIERAVSYDRADLFANCREASPDSEDDSPTTICE